MHQKSIIAAIMATAALTAATGWTTPTTPTRAPSTSASTIRFVVAPTGNEARYRVREQLVGLDLPNDAVGVTHKVTGTIAVDGRGAVIPGESRIVVDVTTLKSDRDRRDGYVQRRILDTEHFPTVELVPTAIRGLPGSLPSEKATVAPRQIEMTGNLTVRGVTRPTTWHGSARYDNGSVTGTAFTTFTFADFNIAQPRVPVVMSVADTIRLEYDFTLVRQR